MAKTLPLIPRTVQPMLCDTVKRAFDRPGWLFEIKWDGFRAIAAVEPETAVRLYSRNQNSLAQRFPEIVGALKNLKHRLYLMVRFWRPAPPGTRRLTLYRSGDARVDTGWFTTCSMCCSWGDSGGIRVSPQKSNIQVRNSIAVGIARRNWECEPPSSASIITSAIDI